jgi:hypothetical protein
MFRWRICILLSVGHFIENTVTHTMLSKSPSRNPYILLYVRLMVVKQTMYFPV